ANASNAQAAGAEASLRWQPLSNLTLEANVSVLRLAIEAPAGAVGGAAAETHSPHHSASLGLHWDYAPDASLDATLYAIGPVSGHDLPGYNRLDLRWRRELSPSLRFELVGQNLLDNRHREFTAPTDPSALEIERSFYGRLVWRD